MTLQGSGKFQEYFRCYVIGQEKVHVMRYDPRQPHHLRYVPESAALAGTRRAHGGRCAEALPRARATT